MNAAQLDRFNRFFEHHYPVILAGVADSDPSGAVRRTRAGFASAYRFWGKVEDDGDPVGWIRRVIAEDRHAATREHSHGRFSDIPSPHPCVDLSAEHRRVVSLARRQRVVASVVIGTSAFVAVGGELLLAHR